MRIPFLILIFIFTFPSFSWGQIQKGTWSLGGELIAAYPGYVSGLPKAYDVHIGSDVGYFFSERIFAEVGLGFKSYAYEWIIDNEHTIPHTDFYFDAAINFRYYINPKHKIKVYGELGAELEIGNSYGEVDFEMQGYQLSEFRINVLDFKAHAEIGFNLFVGKNIALETGVHLLPYHLHRWRSFDYGELDNSYIIKRPQLLSLNLGMRLFLNTNYEEQSLYLPEDCFKQGNFTFGIEGNYTRVIENGYTYPSQITPHINYFLFNRLAVGTSIHFARTYRHGVLGATPSIEYYQPVSSKLQLVPSVATYIGTAADLISSEGFYGDLGSVFNFGIKANYFIGENISVWAGPYFNRNKMPWDVPEYHINLKGGFRYFMVSNKNK